MENEVLTVTEFHGLLNQTLEFAYPVVVIEGEVSSFKVNQGKWVFFDLKDIESTIGCFMTIYNLKVPLEDGMLVKVVASPNLTKWGKFSLTVKEVELSGEGAVKKAFEILKAQFTREGLFLEGRKRPLPQYPNNIALITSRQAAAYNDFVTILSDRWGGLNIHHAQVQVQGIEAPKQIVRAINYFNDRSSEYDILVIIRGGGSAEDLQAFNHEDVVRAIYGSKLVNVVGIGHEDDVSLAELVADVRAATPTDAARRIVPDREQVSDSIYSTHQSMTQNLLGHLKQVELKIERVNHGFMRLCSDINSELTKLKQQNNHNIEQIIRFEREKIASLWRVMTSLDPLAILARGYSVASINGKAIISAKQIKPHDRVMLQLHQGRAELKLNKGSNDARGKKQYRKGKADKQIKLQF